MIEKIWWWKRTRGHTTWQPRQRYRRARQHYLLTRINVLWPRGANNLFKQGDFKRNLWMRVSAKCGFWQLESSVTTKPLPTMDVRIVEVIRQLVELLQKPLQWLLCLLHDHELPLHVVSKISHNMHRSPYKIVWTYIAITAAAARWGEGSERWPAVTAADGSSCQWRVLSIWYLALQNRDH